MRNPTDDEFMGRLIALISDGFNRSLGALERARAVDTRRMHSQYRGVGSRYYDLVTEKITLTARYGVASMRERFEESGPTPEGK
jgi:hypothetical protein